MSIQGLKIMVFHMLATGAGAGTDAGNALNTNGLQSTLDNIATIGTVVGGGLLIISLLVLAGKLFIGGAQAIRESKPTIIAIAVGAVLVVGCQGIANLIKSISGF